MNERFFTRSKVPASEPFAPRRLKVVNIIPDTSINTPINTKPKGVPK
jgi:hypothetical protein